MRIAILALGALMAACASTPAASADYVGSWQLRSIGDRAVAESPRAPTLTIDAQGHVNGNGGCNGFGGQYTHRADTLTFSRIISTMMACANANGDDTVMTQEHAFLSILNGDVRATTEGQTLTLTAIDGRTLHLTRVAAQ